MSEIITVRDPEIIAAEINTIKSTVRQTVIYASIEIGGKLVEAKSLVSHGEWGKWLEENVEYSQSTADYLMRLFQEYGTGQENLFDTWTNSQTFGKLSYSQHIALLALPFEERQEFAEQNHVEDMSTRQLQQAIRERDEALQAQKDAEADAREFNAQLRQANAAKENAQKDKTRAEKSEQNALNLVKKLEGQLAEANKAREDAAAALEQLRENPLVPDAVLELLRQEVAADAAKQATADLEKQLATAKKELEEANRAKEAAENTAREAEQKITDARKESRLSNPAVVVFKTMFEQTKTDVERLADAYKKVLEVDPNAAKNCRAAYNALLDSMDTALD